MELLVPGVGIELRQLSFRFVESDVHNPALVATKRCMAAMPPTPMANDAAPEAARLSGNTAPSMTYHAPLQNDATPAATATCVGRLPHGYRCRSARSSKPGDEDDDEDDEEDGGTFPLAFPRIPPPYVPTPPVQPPPLVLLANGDPALRPIGVELRPEAASLRKQKPGARCQAGSEVE